MTIKDGDIVYMPCVNPVHNETTSRNNMTGETWGSTEYSIPGCVATYIGKGRTNIITREGSVPTLICKAHQMVTRDEIDFINIGSGRHLYENELWMGWI